MEAGLFSKLMTLFSSEFFHDSEHVLRSKTGPWIIYRCGKNFPTVIGGQTF